MSDGLRVLSGIVKGDDGSPVPMVTIDFGQRGFVELEPPLAIQIGTDLILHAQAANLIGAFVAALEGAEIHPATIEKVVREVLGEQPKEQPSRRLDVVTDPKVVREVNG